MPLSLPRSLRVRKIDAAVIIVTMSSLPIIELRTITGTKRGFAISGLQNRYQVIVLSRRL